MGSISPKIFPLPVAILFSFQSWFSFPVFPSCIGGDVITFLSRCRRRKLGRLKLTGSSCRPGNFSFPFSFGFRSAMIQGHPPLPSGSTPPPSPETARRCPPLRDFWGPVLMLFFFFFHDSFQMLLLQPSTPLSLKESRIFCPSTKKKAMRESDLPIDLLPPLMSPSASLPF